MWWDVEKRAAYDQYGHAGFDQRYSTEDIFRGADFSSIFKDLGFGGSIFEDLFGGLGGGGRGGSRRARRGADLEAELELSFEEAARGATKTLTATRREVCTDCRGEGGDRSKCSGCQGAGQIRQSAGFMVIARTCPKCGGQGSQITRACKACRSEGSIPVERTIQVKVPPGVESGMRLRLAGEGEGGVGGRGDLYVHLRVHPHPLFRREGPHLITEYPISVAQAALGAEIEVPSLNGRVSMKIPSGTQSGTVFRVKGKGVSDVETGRAGDLLVRAVVKTPTNLNAAQRKILGEFAKTFGDEAHPAHRSFVAKIKELLKK